MENPNNPNNPNERLFFISKDVLDTVNSVSWFLMDAFWMLQFKSLTFSLIFPTVISGLFLCYIEKRKPVTLINIAVFCWICMNISWMFSDVLKISLYLTVAKACFALGICFIIASIIYSENVSDTFSHFKRFRIKNFRR